MTNVDHFSIIILLSLLIPGGLLGLLIILWWFRILSRPRVLRIIREQRTTTTAGGRIHPRTTIHDTKLGKVGRWSFTRGGDSHADLESGMAVGGGGGGKGAGFTGGGLRRKGGEETSGRVPVAVAGGRGKGYGWENRRGGGTSWSDSSGESTSTAPSSKMSAVGGKQDVRANTKTGGAIEREEKERRFSLSSAILPSKKKRKDRGITGTTTGTGGRARKTSRNRHHMGILGPGIDTGISKRISTKAVVGTRGIPVGVANRRTMNDVSGSGLQGLNSQDLQNLRELERRYSRGSKRGSGGIESSGSGGHGLGMAAMIASIRNSGSTGGVTGTGGRSSMRDSGGWRDSMSSGTLRDLGVAVGMINPASLRNSRGSAGVRDSVLRPADDPQDSERYGPWYRGSGGEPASAGQDGPRDHTPTIPLPMPGDPRPGDPSPSNRSSNIAAALEAGVNSNRSSNIAAALASNRTSSNIGVPLNSSRAGGQTPPPPPPLPPQTSTPMSSPIDPAQRYSGPPLPPPAIPTAAAERGRGDSIIRDSGLSQNFMFPTAVTPPPPASPSPAITPPSAVPRVSLGVVTPPAAGSTGSGYGDDFKGFGKLPVPVKAKVRERDSDESSVD